MFRSASQCSSYKAPEHHAILRPVRLLSELVLQGTGGGEVVGEKRGKLEWGVQQACFQMKTICGGQLYKQAIQINHLRKSREAK